MPGYSPDVKYWTINSEQVPPMPASSPDVKYGTVNNSPNQKLCTIKHSRNSRKTNIEIFSKDYNYHYIGGCSKISLMMPFRKILLSLFVISKGCVWCTSYIHSSIHVVYLVSGFFYIWSLLFLVSFISGI